MSNAPSTEDALLERRRVNGVVYAIPSDLRANNMVLTNKVLNVVDPSRNASDYMLRPVVASAEFRCTSHHPQILTSAER